MILVLNAAVCLEGISDPSTECSRLFRKALVILVLNAAFCLEGISDPSTECSRLFRRH